MNDTIFCLLFIILGMFMGIFMGIAVGRDLSEGNKYCYEGKDYKSVSVEYKILEKKYNKEFGEFKIVVEKEN